MRLTIDKSGSVVQFFSPDPTLCQVPATIAASAATGSAYIVTVPISSDGSGWIKFLATGNVYVYLNGQSTKYMLYPANTIADILLNLAVTSVSFLNPNTSSSITLYRWGA